MEDPALKAERQRREQQREYETVAGNFGEKLAVVERDAFGTIVAVDDERPVVPTTPMVSSAARAAKAFDELGRAAGVAIRGAGQRAPIKKKVRATEVTERDYDRFDERAARRRSKKATKSRNRRVRAAETTRDTLLAQLRLASGQSPTASPALVANAKKALQPRLDALRAEFGDTLTDEEAYEGLRIAVEQLR